MSAQIREVRAEYGCLTRAIEGAHAALSGVIAKARYWEKLRDIQQLVERGVLVRNPAGGRSTSYSLATWSLGR